MLRILILAGRLIFALALVAFVFWAIIDVTLFFVSEHASFSGIPWWRSVLVVLLALLCAFVSAYASYTMIRYTVVRFRSAKWGY